MKNNNPLVDVLAILLCMLAVVALGQYFIKHKKDSEPSLHKIEQRLELKQEASKSKVQLEKSFESAVKVTNLEETK
jgi:hypothetical protein